MHIPSTQTLFYSTLVLLPSMYLWRRLYKTYEALKKDLVDEQLFHERHNCVLMYSRNLMRGWPPNVKGVSASTANVTALYDPYLYFINTAKKSIDIAVMALAIPKVIVALTEAQEKGVKIRIIVNFESMKERRDVYNQLIKSGVKVLYYLSKLECMSSIMHYKYMVKDYSKDSGYVCFGSLNLTNSSAFLDNYEDAIFSSNQNIVQQFHANFQECWAQIKADNGNLYNQTMLKEAKFLQ